MKTLFSIATAALIAASAPALLAQEPVSTGIIQGVVPKAGVLTIRSDQTQRPVTFYGMDRANIFTENGQPAQVTDLQEGSRVTVQYASRGNRWYISKVILGAGANAAAGSAVTAPAASTAPSIVTDPALNTRAARDGDITTEPGSRAAIDGDRTTVPNNNAAFDNDITTQPGSRSGVRRGNSNNNR